MNGIENRTFSNTNVYSYSIGFSELFLAILKKTFLIND